MQTVSRLLGLVFVLTATHVLAPAAFGRYSIVTALVMIGNTVADFGTTTVITRRVSRSSEEADALLTGTLLASAALGLACYGAVLVFVTTAKYPPGTLGDAAIGGASLPLDAALTSILGALDGRGLIARRALISFARLVLIAGGGAVVLGAGMGVRAALAMLPLGAALAYLPALLTARRRRVWSLRLRVDVRRSLELLRAAVPYAAFGGIHIVVLRFDVVVLSILAGRAETAQYDIATRVTEALSYLGTAVAAPSLYLLSRRHAVGDDDGLERAFDETLRVSYLLGLGLAAGLVALHTPIVLSLFGRRYEPAALPLAVLGAQLSVYFVVAIQGTLILASGITKLALGFGAVDLAAIVVLDLLLIPRYGAVGAAVAMALSQLIASLAFGVYLRRTLAVLTRFPSPRVLLAAFTCGIAAWSLAFVSLGLAVVGGSLVYAAALAATGALRRDDLVRLRSLLRRPAS